MIYYFSGTGNSEWVAKTLAALTNDLAVNITTIMKNGGAKPAGDRVGLVFPIYAWGTPKIVNEFIETLNIGSDGYAYAVCTCGDEAGRAMQKLKRRFPWKAALSVTMPNNYIPMYDVDAPELEREKIAAAKERLPLIAEKINDRVAVTDVRQGSFAGLKAAIVNPVCKAFASSTKPFMADDTCTACGLCAKNCPRSAIQIENGKPCWVKKHCIQCMACIHRCPAKAIQYGEGTRTKGRYSFSADGQ